MSFTKITLNQILEAQNKIHEESLDKNDLTDLLNIIDSTIYIQEKINDKSLDVAPILNEIVSDVISVISTALQGHYRLATSGLRNLLEISCSAIFYLDHPIEYKLYRDFDLKADKYVSTLVNEYYFFKTIYIKTFYPNIDTLQKEIDSCSLYLNKTYAKLCDVVHGRYLTLTKTDELKIEYNQIQFSKFKTMLEYTIGSLFLMYTLKFNDFSNQNIMKIVDKTNTLKK
ncbi:hypothetical protein AB4Y90_13930 [Chryseobacterium sp. 2TAF14]|uniref:hypothetical protein n=1 Tax=Chryseobacterium sp. 2TAF14 TaxID=3233007 RepID=UPI003F92DCEE